MNIINNTPFEFVALAGKGPGLKDYIVFILKGTFELIHNQTCRVSARQLPIFESDQHRGDPASTSVKVETDFVTFKPEADIVLLGKAYAPGGSAASCPVSLSIDSYRKDIQVFGDRTWEIVGGVPGPTTPQPFTTMALIYENAFGGADPVATSDYSEQNPIGKGFYTSAPQPAGGYQPPLPNLEDPADLIGTDWIKHPDPVCFAWYGKSWQPRLQKAGTKADLESYAPDLPPSFDWGFNNGAWPGFIRSYLSGNERIALENCEPSGNFVFYLPGIRPQVMASFGVSEQHIHMDLDTVCVIMEEVISVSGADVPIQKQAYLVWRGRREVDEQHTFDRIKSITIN